MHVITKEYHSDPYLASNHEEMDIVLPTMRGRV